MRALIFFIALFTLAAHAGNCPKLGHQRASGWRLYPEDQERELWHCRLLRSVQFKQLEFCAGRMVSSMPISDYLGLSGIEEWKNSSYSNQVYATRTMVVSFGNDKEGEAVDTPSEMKILMKPLADIMAADQYRYEVTIQKSTGRATYLAEKKKHPCILCGGWSTFARAELQCEQVR